ncbi:hypothetical protein H5P28_11730 [Ruficoccus amylovorans]|uniref:Uncharacterized protein n=1 Tax=Ruficoccus amylovorans TaxID=1804625 RepID=A0A842HHA4_9BACT|nr:hypothetical protein [Ruficoccus amylovorans]MBC2594927.1 hypothetical protein [Ruficoccus amylovorans]
MKLVAVLGFVLQCAVCAGTEPEAFYAEWAANQLHASREVVLEDRTRCDLLTEDYAIEIDFAPKWAEAVGQSLHYASMTGRRAAVILILTRPGDTRYVQRVRRMVAHYNLPLDLLTLDATQMQLDQILDLRVIQ